METGKDAEQVLGCDELSSKGAPQIPIRWFCGSSMKAIAVVSDDGLSLVSGLRKSK